MQTFLCSLIIIAAALYVTNQWLPHRFKQRFMSLFGKKLSKSPKRACSACSSCGDCESGDERQQSGSAKPIVIFR
jgi:hypothetical protein